MKNILFYIILSFIIFNLSANNYFSDDELSVLGKGKEIKTIQLYSPKHTLERNYADKLPFSLKDYSVFAELKGILNIKPNQENQLLLNNYLIAFSQMKGMQYYSWRDKKYQTLIVKCHTIKKPVMEDGKIINKWKSKKQVPDIKLKSIVPLNYNYLLQQDNRYGNVIYEVKVENKFDGVITTHTKNLEAIAFIFTLADTGKWQTYFAFVPHNDKYLVYGAFHVKLKSEMYTKMIPNKESFVNRLNAVFQWLKNKVEKE